MKKSIWIFLLAVLLPSIVLGWLAVRSADEQQIILENRTAALYQKETENAAVAARALVDDERRAFNETVRQLLAKANPQLLANNFSTELARTWPRKAIGFSLGETGMLCAPPPQRAKNNPEWEKFLLGNASFLAGTTPATVYWVSGDELAKPDQLRKSKTGPAQDPEPDAGPGMKLQGALLHDERRSQPNEGQPSPNQNPSASAPLPPPLNTAEPGSEGYPPADAIQTGQGDRGQGRSERSQAAPAAPAPAPRRPGAPPSPEASKEPPAEQSKQEMSCAMSCRSAWRTIPTRPPSHNSPPPTSIFARSPPAPPKGW